MFSGFFQPSQPQEKYPIHVSVKSNYGEEKPKEQKLKVLKQKGKLAGQLAPFGTLFAPKTKALKAPKSILLKIEENVSITINHKLLVAKCGNFSDIDHCRTFATGLKSMIMDGTDKGRVINYQFGHNANAICRFLKILVIGDNYYLMPLRTITPDQNLYSVWSEGSFTLDIMMSQYRSILNELLSMIKRQKTLINTNSFLIFCVELFVNRRLTAGRQDGFHKDIDIFNGSIPDYISVTNISQQRYGLSAEMKHEDRTKSYALLTNPCETILFKNQGGHLVHRTPTLQQINRKRYNTPESYRRGVEISHESKLTDDELRSDVITNLNHDINNVYDPRDLIRIHIYEKTDEFRQDEMDEMRDITRLVDELVESNYYVSPIVNYKVTAFDRIPDSDDHSEALDLLRHHSLGGKSKKKRRNKRRSNKRRSKKRTQRGGERLSEYFAIYANDERTADLLAKNVNVIV